MNINSENMNLTKYNLLKKQFFFKLRAMEGVLVAIACLFFHRIF